MPIASPDCYVTYSFYCGFPGGALVLEFAEAVDAVSFLMNSKDALSMWLFDDQYNRVSTCSDTFGFSRTPCYEYLGPNAIYENNWRVTAASDDRNVRYAVIGAYGTPGVIDAISYSVPEPGTLVLLSLSLLGLGVRRRKQ